MPRVFNRKSRLLGGLVRLDLYGSTVPSLPVAGLTLPLVLKLSSLVVFGSVALVGAT